MLVPLRCYFDDLALDVSVLASRTAVGMFNIRNVVGQDCGMKELTASRSGKLAQYNPTERRIQMTPDSGEPHSHLVRKH
ncbi:uncharacterized protein H6S33_009046 [Morchella sextelata]|uniref:uncharacterized protein n=1 Tax=Morchella sextelata TaxID=1174677 RepID=UPI001D03B9CE|nr:uncharacterized protein H6S33_009046 [Morchella sextelata]KAH0612666.1 hypothetical protein H6S33_009046 [Morchella sextelata]